MRDQLYTNRSRTTQETAVVTNPGLSIGYFDHRTSQQTGSVSRTMYPYTYTPLLKAMDDVTGSGYEAARQRGDVVMNDMKSYLRTVRCGQGGNFHIESWYPNSGLYKTCAGTNCSFSNLAKVDWNYGTSDADLVALGNRALMSAYASITEAEMLSLVSIVEFKKTCRTMESVFGQILFFIQKGVSIKRKLKRGLLTATQAASLWLEVRYGLRPLYYEIKSAAAALERLTDGNPKRYRFSATETETLEVVPEEILGNTQYPDLSWYGTRTAKTEASANAGVLIKPSISVKDVLGFTDITSSLWEVVPFSFIIDWFLNTGDYFASLNPKVNIGYEGSWVTLRTQVNQRQSINRLVFNQVHPWKGEQLVSGIDEERTERRVTRYAYPDRPSLPQLDIRMSWAKTTDILALIYSLASREFRKGLRF